MGVWSANKDHEQPKPTRTTALERSTEKAEVKA